MATLNIKGFPNELLERLQERARRERRSVAQEVTRLLETALKASDPHSIRALRGLGRHAWAGIDAAAHVDAERQAWD